MEDTYASSRGATELCLQDRLLPAMRRKCLDWSIVFSNPELFTSLLSTLVSVMGEAFPFTVQRSRNPVTGDLQTAITVNTLVQSNTMFVSAYLPCTGVDKYNCPEDEGFSVSLSVNKLALRSFLKRVTGNMNMALYQYREGVSPDLHIVVQDGKNGRRIALTTMAWEKGDVMPDLSFSSELHLPVELLRQQLELVSGVASNDSEMTIELCDLGAGNQLLLLSSDGIAGHVETYIYVRDTPELESTQGKSRSHGTGAPAGAGAGSGSGAPPPGPAPGPAPAPAPAPATGTTTSKHRCLIDLADPAADASAVDTAVLPRLYSERFKAQTLSHILHNMRGETYVDLFLGGGDVPAVDESGRTQSMPLLLRLPLDHLQGGYVAFVVAPLCAVQT